MNFNDIERTGLKEIRKHNARVNSEGFNNDFPTIQRDYELYYRSYLQDLIVNLIHYKNAPMTLDQRFLEWQLRNFGVCAVAVDSKDKIAMLNGDKADADKNYWGNVVKLGMFGYLTAPATQPNPFSNDKKDRLHFITNLTYQDLTKGYVVIPNKFNFYFNFGFNGVVTDFQLIDRVAKTLSLIKASEIANVADMRQQYIYFVKNGNLSGKNIIDQIQQGIKAIGIDSDINDINALVTLNNLDVENYLPALKEQWNNELNEMLTMLGVNTVGVDKRERLVATEADANAQLTEASANIYINARQEQFNLINEVVGTDIEVEFNQEAYRKLVQLGNENVESGDDDEADDSSENS